ncbi:MAG: serine/threonine protein kinase [Myxococcales bacterium]|nr:serine/threonine protein kinase [Myxococcales bacterium]MDH3485345.1 serine/threonine protein kinase [Myxococcales bacterium]
MSTRSTYFSDPAARAFLQKRVAAFGLIGMLLGGTALLFRVLMGILFGFLEEELRNPSFILHALSILPMLAIWLICRRGELKLMTIGAVEYAGLFGASLGYIGMGMNIRPEVGADTITAFILALMLFARSVFVPSSARRTAILGVLIGIPLVAAMYAHYLSVDLGIWRRFGFDSTGLSKYRVATSQAVITVMWWTLTVGLASLASRVIHRLREEVSDIQSLGQYKLERKLGEGAMGVVYEATHGMLKRPTAIKLLKPQIADPEALDRFRREVQLTAKLTHPNTVTIYDYGRTPEGLFYYAMELLSGATLTQVVEAGGPQPIARVVRVLRDAALALNEAHAVGLIHRDIKPSNIMLARQGGVPDVTKVLDFGLVKNLGKVDDLERTNTLSIKGTPNYLSPEAIQDPQGIDARSDIYSLGAVGYYLLAGRHMFEGKTIIEVCMHHLHTEPVPLNELCANGIPPRLEELIFGCLAKSQGDRPSSGQELADALDKLDVARWTRADAESWWDAHSPDIEQAKEPIASKVNGKTVAVDLEER